MMPPLPEQRTVCPHCGVTFKAQWARNHLSGDADGAWWVRFVVCADCDRLIAYLQHYIPARAPAGVAPAVVPMMDALRSERLIRPRTASRKPIPTNVPKPIAEDYTEAANVLSESAKASAALSRRCLQNLLSTAAGAKQRDLYDQIQEVLDADMLPSDLAEDLDTVRLIGKFAAHPVKSKSTGEIVAVEPGEAEWNLDVLDDLFDFFYARPDRRKAKRDAFEGKLKEAGGQSLAEIRKKKPE
jgi:hypothetical protein